jgi:mRNA interferase MazF
LAIKYPIHRRTIVRCDFDMGGFRPPEMVKPRPVVVLVGRLPHRDNLATIVPLSTTPPNNSVDYQCEIELERPLPPPFNKQTCWVKADMLATVSFARLDLFRTSRDHEGKRRYLQPKVTEAQFDLIRETILKALRFTR